VTQAAVAHGSLSVTITERTDVSQPNALSKGGQTIVTAAFGPSTSGNPVKRACFVFNAGRQSRRDRARR